MYKNSIVALKEKPSSVILILVVQGLDTFFKMVVDSISIGATIISCCSAFYFKSEYLFDWIMGQFVKVCIVFPKTSKLKELNNNPIGRIKISKFDDANAWESVYKAITLDPNFKIYGIREDLLVVLRCLYNEREDLMLSSMDTILISNNGFEVLIVESEEKHEYDRSILLDLASYRSTTFKFHLAQSIIFGVLSFIIWGNEDVRTKIFDSIYSRMQNY